MNQVSKQDSALVSSRNTSSQKKEGYTKVATSYGQTALSHEQKETVNTATLSPPTILSSNPSLGSVVTVLDLEDAPKRLA